jgi:UDP-N-acetylmuramoyl-tripeptide--D-alanyl-D-alanine ligase
MQLQHLYQLYLSSAGVTTDTRKVTAGTIFFALKGDKFNANLFAEDALNQGASHVVVEEIANDAWPEKYGERLIVVENVLATLQQLAGYHRRQFSFPVLAITGSNGKTTTKELVAGVLSKKYRTAFTYGNLNNHIGIPLTLLAIDKEETDFAVIEMGANHQGEIASYCTYVQPDYGLITNVGLAHIEGFGGFEGVVKGKTELYRDIEQRGRKIFVSADNAILLSKISAAGHTITYGKKPEAYSAGEVLSGGEFLSVKCGEVTIQTNLVGDYNFENVMSAVCIGKYFGVDMAHIKSAIENYVPSNNRSQKVSYGTNTIIMDAYNANPSSMHEALNNFENLLAAQGYAQALVVLGEMMELGAYSEAEHQKIVQMLMHKNWDNVTKVLVGDGFRIAADAGKGFIWFSTTENLKKWFKEQQMQHHLILVKGSRKNELEKILKD